MPEKKCVTKNDGKNYQKCEILAYLKNNPKPKFTSKTIDFRGKRQFFQTNSSHGAKHSPSSSPLCRPSAGFGASRAITFFAAFDPILLIDVLHRSRKPQKYLYNFIRALLWLNISSNEPREDLFRKGNVSQKMMKKMTKNVKFWLI